MIRSRRGTQNKLISGINITPFTDICLVLLIIFMVTATALSEESSLKIRLPKAATADTPMPSSLTVRIGADRAMFLNNFPVTMATLPAKMRAVQQQSDVKLVVVKADEHLPYQMVIDVIDVARNLGIEGIALSTRVPEAGEER